MIANFITKNTSPDYKYFIESPNNLIEWFNIKGLSSENEYVPIFAPKCNQGIYNKLVIEYSVVKDFSKTVLKNYGRLYRALTRASLSKEFKTASMPNSLGVMKGMIYEFNKSTGDIDILFLVGVKTEYMVKMLSVEDLDHSKFAIFVSEKFMTSPLYKRMYNRIHKDIVLPHLELGVDVIMTKNIVEKCFKNRVELPKFKTLNSMREYLHAFNEEI